MIFCLLFLFQEHESKFLIVNYKFAGLFWHLASGVYFVITFQNQKLENQIRAAEVNQKVQTCYFSISIQFLMLIINVVEEAVINHNQWNRSCRWTQPNTISHINIFKICRIIRNYLSKLFWILWTAYRKSRYGRFMEKRPRTPLKPFPHKFFSNRHLKPISSTWIHSKIWHSAENEKENTRQTKSFQ